jgi:hypothetical protein
MLLTFVKGSFQTFLRLVYHKASWLVKANLLETRSSRKMLTAGGASNSYLVCYVIGNKCSGCGFMTSSRAIKIKMDTLTHTHIQLETFCYLSHHPRANCITCKYEQLFVTPYQSPLWKKWTTSPLFIFPYESRRPSKLIA